VSDVNELKYYNKMYMKHQLNLTKFG